MARSYTVLSVKQAEDTLFTEVEYTNDVGEIITTVVSHFQPQTIDDVRRGIVNRFLSENQKLQADKRLPQIISEIALGARVTL